MNARIIKILIVFFLVMMIFTNYQVLAVNNPYLNNPEDYKTSIENQNSVEFKKKTEKVLGVVNTVGVACSVIILCIIGIRYMLGTVEEKAEYKKTMLGYMVGALLLFTASTIPNVLYQWGTSLGDKTQSTPQTPPKNPNIPAKPVPQFN